MNYYRRYMGDYARDTARLSLSEHGAYALLLDEQYATEEALPVAVDDLCRICRASNPAERKAVKAVAEKFFPVVEGVGRMNPRAEQELAKGEAAIEAMRKAGREGARKRWGKPKGNGRVPHREPHNPPHREPHQNPNGVPNGVPIDPPTTNTGSSLRSDPDSGSPLRYEPAAEAAPDEVIWGAGLKLLGRAGVSESGARSFLGSLRKIHDDGDIAAAIWRCMAEKPVDPRAWLKAALGDRKRGVVV